MRARSTAVPKTVAEVLRNLDAEMKAGRAAGLAPLPYGFDPLDAVLGGGMRAGELVLVGGVPGVGKTIFAMQCARNLALAGRPVLYACYEHEEPVLLARLLAMELGELPHSEDDLEMEKLRLGIQDAAMRGGLGLADVLHSEDLIEQANAHLESYADRMLLIKASGAHTGVEELEQVVVDQAANRPVLFVDYLQKVSVRPEPADEAEKVTRIAEGLKDLALRHDVPIMCIAAADREGLKAKRLRLHHLRGSSALAYECDIALILNDKFSCVSKVHLAYDPVRSSTFKDYVVVSVEKNRGGPTLVDLEFRKDFSYYRFDPTGGLVAENLIDERLYTE
jgi:replicative DNA helicase